MLPYLCNHPDLIDEVPGMELRGAWGMVPLKWKNQDEIAPIGSMIWR